ncbi:MAG: ABC transporter permease [Anaerolineae bacterium]
MQGYLVRRLLLYLVVLFVASGLVFSIIHLMPGDPLDLVVKPFAPREIREEARQRLGLDRPIHQQYLLFLRNAVRGDFGRSLKYGDKVSKVIGSRVVPTLQLTFIGLLLSYVVAIPLGIVAALRPRSWIDLSSMTVALIGVCIPGFWLAMMLIIVFGVELRWLPVTGYGGLLHFVLPASALAAEGVGMNARMMRSSMLEVLNQEYVVVARGKGLRERTVVLKHALRNALLPMTALLGLRIGWLIGGDVIIEYVFAWPGLGRLLVDSIMQRDYLVFQAMMLILVSCVVLGNLLADLLYAVVDPRISYE